MRIPNLDEIIHEHLALKALVILQAQANHASHCTRQDECEVHENLEQRFNVALGILKDQTDYMVQGLEAKR